MYDYDNAAFLAIDRIKIDSNYQIRSGIRFYWSI